ncbi:MAG: hypothetical protein HY319_19095 [Armatimonadetes bacterium]|nr:hypothetical protein [Armatimonadota bacterium]
MKFSGVLSAMVCLLVLSAMPAMAGTEVAEIELDGGAAVGGIPLEGTLVLTEAAPAEGIWVELHATGPAYAPGAVHVPAGQKTVRFTVVTDPVADTTPVQVHAMIRGMGPSRLLMLEGTPEGFAAAAAP